MTRLALILTVLALPAAPAHAQWSAPADLGRGIMPGETFPRAAIAADGTSVVVWWRWRGSTASAGPYGLRIATGDRRGRFRARVLTTPTPGAIDLFPFAQGRGRHVVIWSDSRGLHMARSGAANRLILSGPARAVDVVRDGAGWLVLYGGEFAGIGFQKIHVARFDARGRLDGAPHMLGLGWAFPRWDRGGLLAVDERGTATAVWTRRLASPYASLEGEEVVSTRPRGGAFSASAVVDPLARAASVAGRTGTGTVLGWTSFVREKEWGFYGTLRARIGATTFTVPALPREPARGTFAPSFMPLAGGRALAVYQYHDPARHFLTGPVRAAVVGPGAPAGVQRLTDGSAKEPQLAALSGGRTLVVWSLRDDWRAALADASGKMRPVAAPRGAAAPANHTAQTNRDLRAGGRYAILTWDTSGRVRASVRAFR